MFYTFIGLFVAYILAIGFFKGEFLYWGGFTVIHSLIALQSDDSAKS